jgi:hypothetical protein
MALGLAGCASHSSSGPDATAVDAAPAPDLGASTDTAAVTDRAPSSEAGAPDLAPASGVGVVTVREEGAETVAEARFFEPVPDPPPSLGCGCQEYQMNGCRIRSCGTGPHCSREPPPPAPRSFGAGTLTVARPAGSPLALSPPAGGAYAPVRAVGKLGAAGALVTVDGAGGIVPSFHAAAPIPEPFELAEPSVSRGQPIRLRWKPGPTGQVEAAVTSLFKPDMSWTETTATCVAPATVGELALPSPPFPINQVSLRVRRLGTAVVAAGAFNVTVEAVVSDVSRDLPVVSVDAGAGNFGAEGGQ